MTRLIDVLERSLWTFIQSFAAAVIAPDVFNVNIPLRAKLGIGISAGLFAVLKNLSIDATLRGQLRAIGAAERRRR